MEFDNGKPYIYQPYGSQHKANWETKRLFRIMNVPLTTVDGVTRKQAEAILEILQDEKYL